MKQGGRTLRRQAEVMEAKLQATSATAPAMVVVLSFTNDPVGAAKAYAVDLKDYFKLVRPDLYVEVLDLAMRRPGGLKASWERPRQWLDYVPSREETADLRPDLRPPGPHHTRMDWNP